MAISQFHRRKGLIERAVTQNLSMINPLNAVHESLTSLKTVTT